MTGSGLGTSTVVIILIPFFWIIPDIMAHALQFFVIPNNMVVKPGLPGEFCIRFSNIDCAYPFILIYNNCDICPTFDRGRCCCRDAQIGRLYAVIKFLRPYAIQIGWPHVVIQIKRPYAIQIGRPYAVINKNDAMDVIGHE